jgi:ABC-type Fe3+-hydroxamate transport system substrate-binding protein
MTVTDHLGRTVVLPSYPPRRIVSLCPSQTELLFALGAGGSVVGATQWCVHPKPQVDAVVKVGGTKKVNLKKIEALQPDFILCEKEENTPDMVAALAARYPVYVTNVESVADALRMIADVGHVVGQAAAATALITQIEAAFTRIPRSEAPLRVAYLIWKDPYMAVGPTTYINDVLARCGLINVLANHAARYPVISLQELATAQPQMVLLSSEPYEFTAEHVGEIQGALPQATIQLVDGEMFSWYGSRMLPAAQYLAQWLKQVKAVMIN